MREGKCCVNCGQAYPWWRRWCRAHVYPVRLVPKSRDPHIQIRRWYEEERAAR